MEDMIDHHMMAVLMARLCEVRAVHEELLMLCQQIEATQTAEIEEMQAWLEDWYGISYEPEMTKRMQRQLEDLASMSGAEFEIAFMTMMIGHHETAVKEGERCVERAYHRDLVELCKDIVEVQSMEIVIMENWLADWYEICDDDEFSYAYVRGGLPHRGRLRRAAPRLCRRLPSHKVRRATHG